MITCETWWRLPEGDVGGEAEQLHAAGDLVRNWKVSTAPARLRPLGARCSALVGAREGEAQPVKSIGCGKLGVRISAGAVWQCPQAKSTLEGLPAQDPSHFLQVKLFCFSD